MREDWFVSNKERDTNLYLTGGNESVAEPPAQPPPTRCGAKGAGTRVLGGGGGGHKKTDTRKLSIKVAILFEAKNKKKSGWGGGGKAPASWEILGRKTLYIYMGYGGKVVGGPHLTIKGHTHTHTASRWGGGAENGHLWVSELRSGRHGYVAEYRTRGVYTKTPSQIYSPPPTHGDQISPYTYAVRTLKPQPPLRHYVDQKREKGYH